ncbi:CHAT domain-containing protein [Lacipirellula parvula]|nr:CHAT domain-containing protein [Lacipirellula parvula]
MQASASGLKLAPWTVLAAIMIAASSRTAQAQLGDTIPSRAYYNGIDELYRGNLRDAQRTFTRSFTGSVKTLGPTGTIRWIDAICYHAMLGETLYHWGQPQLALQQFDQACTLFLQYPRWMMRVQFNPQINADASLTRVVIPWGVPQRRFVPGKYPTTLPISQGQVDASQQIQQGGVVQAPQLWPVDVVEVVRCTALALRRRNEILGPLGPHDAISKNVAAALARGGHPPNHWSGAWTDVLYGIALVGVGDREQAQQRLERGMLVAGQFDHPLTCVALLEQGRLALDQGDAAAAADFFTEASYSAYLFRDVGLVDDALRNRELARFAAGVVDPNQPLVNAAAWARRERYDLISARLSLSMADELLTAGDVKNAAVALTAGVALLRDARTGILGNYAQYLDARLQFAQGRGSADAAMATAITGQQKISHQLFQIGLANRMFDDQTLPMRSASSIYEVLLSDPRPIDVMTRPIETIAAAATAQPQAFDRWILAAIDRKNIAAVLEVTDFAKRRRFHSNLAWGGRLAALRDVALAPVNRLTPQQHQQQTEIFARYPALADAAAEAARLQQQLSAAWTPGADEAAMKRLPRLWSDYGDAVARREDIIANVGLARMPADVSFPPTMAPIDFQSNLQPGKALLVFHDTPDGMLAILLTNKAVTNWNLGPSSRLGGQVSEFLRAIGNVDANHEVPVEELASDKWQASSAELYKAIFTGASIDPAALKELIVIPDGVLWYVPFEALIAKVDSQPKLLSEIATIRYAPTAALAFSFDGSWRRIQRTGLVAGAMIPGDEPEQEKEALAALQEAIPGPMPLTTPAPAATPLLATLLDALVVLDEIDALGADPLSWSPLPIDRVAQQGFLDQWMAIPGDGPQRILLPGMHTAAERGGKASRRRRGGDDAVAPGDELFFASCGLMSAGADTLLLSRWRVGGQTTLDLVREFIQDLPHNAAASAWQRSVQLIRETPVDPAAELRVKEGKEPVEFTAKHPFFWAGYLVVDAGWRPVEQEDPAIDPAAAAAAGQPAAGAPAAGAAPAQPSAPAPPSPTAPGAVPDQPMKEADPTAPLPAPAPVPIKPTPLPPKEGEAPTPPPATPKPEGKPGPGSLPPLEEPK